MSSGVGCDGGVADKQIIGVLREANAASRSVERLVQV
jgi:hypothetical protein